MGYCNKKNLMTCGKNYKAIMRNNFCSDGFKYKCWVETYDDIECGEIGYGTSSSVDEYKDDYYNGE